MFSDLASKTVHMLYKSSVLSEDEIELYKYGFYVLFSYLFYFLLSLFLGAFFQLLLEGILFFILFTLIRVYAGGVHASKENSCILFTSLSFLLCFKTIKLCSTLKSPELGFLLLIISAIIIVYLAPLDTPEKPLNVIERIYFRKKSRLILGAIILLAICSLYIYKLAIFFVCAISLSLEGILLFLGFIKRKL